MYVTATLLQRGCQEMVIKRVGARKKGAGVENGVRRRRRRRGITDRLAFNLDVAIAVREKILSLRHDFLRTRCNKMKIKHAVSAGTACML